MITAKNTLKCFLVAAALVALALQNTARPEIVVLKDGSKFIGQISQDGNKVRIATKGGTLAFDKDQIQSVYKDAATILKENGDILLEASNLIAGANKIPDRKERNDTLDKSIEMLIKIQSVCMEVIDIVPGEDGKKIGNQFREINTTIKHARSLKVLGSDAMPPPPAVQPPKPKSFDQEKIAASKDSYDTGLMLFNSRQYEKARALFQQAIDCYPAFPEPYAKLADAYSMLRNDEMAYRNYQRFLSLLEELESLSPEQAKTRDDILNKTQKYRIIENKADALNESLAYKLLNFAARWSEENNYFFAEQVFELVGLIEPGNNEAKQGLNKARSELKREIENQTSEENEALSENYFRNASMLMDIKKYEEAIEKFRKAMSFRRNFARAFYKTGECYEMLKDNKKAIEYYQLCLRCVRAKVLGSEADEELSAQAVEGMERLDASCARLRKTKSLYVANMIALANDCFTLKYPFLAVPVVRSIEYVDPNNKNLPSLLAKLEQSRATAAPDSPKPEAAKETAKPGTPKPSKTGARDLVKEDWSIEGESPELQKWMVTNGRIEADPRLANQPAFYIYKGSIPDKFVLTVSFVIEKARSSTTDHCGIVYALGGSTGFNYAGVALRDCLPANKMELIKDDASMRIILNGKVVRDNITPGQPVIGLMAKNCFVVFSVVTLQEIQ